MSAFDVEGLIALVKKYAFIYDISNSKYKNAGLKAAVWKSIAQKLGSNCDTVRHKWKTIRDGYMKYKKQVQLSEGTGKKVIEYVWSPHLAFLDNYASRRSGIRYELPQEQSFEEASSSSSNSFSSDQMLVEVEPPIKRQRTIDQDKVDHILNFVNQQNTNRNDAVDHLFMSYAESFKKFAPRLQAELKIELAQLFSNAELKELNKARGDGSPKPGGGSGSSPEYHAIVKEEIDDQNDCLDITENNFSN